VGERAAPAFFYSGNQVEPIREVARELDSRVEAIGFEVVEVEWGGSLARPILRLRVDHPESRPGAGVTVADCARVSRTLEEWLDAHPGVSERYVLEVSSPGVERPLRRKRDFVRFVGAEVKIKVAASSGRKSRMVQGILKEVTERDESFGVVVRSKDGTEVSIPEGEIAQANLVFRWNEEE
jgi:ribosome maturation factor RimP